MARFRSPSITWPTTDIVSKVHTTRSFLSKHGPVIFTTVPPSIFPDSGANTSGKCAASAIQTNQSNKYECVVAIFINRETKQLLYGNLCVDIKFACTHLGVYGRWVGKTNLDVSLLQYCL